MKHPFLPYPEQRRLGREYVIRAAIVSIFLLSVAGVIGLVALFPAYIRAYLAGNSALDTVVSLKNDASSATAAALQGQLAADADLAARAAALAEPPPSDLVTAIVRVRQSVRVTAISVDQSADGSATASVQGVAPTREGLVAFKVRLESAIPGSIVELPASQLTQRTDLEFSLKITKTMR